jgi:hypothetical protein
MPPEARALHKQVFISDYVQEFRETKNVMALLKALLLVLEQQRTLELIYGVYCHLVRRPSPVYPAEDGATLSSILKHCASVPQGNVSRAGLIERFGTAFRVDLLPHDFESARIESIWHDETCLIIGEYGARPRLAHVTPEACTINDHYLHVPGVKHIHSILKYGDSGELLVSTGDTRKFLDLWSASNRGLSFVRRLRKRLAGFTAAAAVNGKYYFGTDFSDRPNFIWTLEGKKFFFPMKAYKLYANAFQVFGDRFIVSINTELDVAGGRKTLTVFDTAPQRFIYCEYWQAADPNGSSRDPALAPQQLR